MIGKNKNKYGYMFLFFLAIAYIMLVIIKPLNLNIIKGSSMSPSLKENDLLITYKYRNTKVGDIATFKPTKDWNTGDKILVKRVIAQGGDTISIKNNKLYINNILFIANLNEIYNVSIPEINLTIKDGYYLMVGDNYKHSRDSIYFLLNKQFENKFLIKKDSILGTASSEESKVKEVREYVEAYYK